MKQERMMQEEIEKLPYRNNVGFIVYNREKQFLLVQLVEWPKNWWKFPQGGMEEGESEETTAQRELSEELELNNYRIIAKSTHILQYDWPEDSIKKAGSRWRGQIQRFLLVEYLGTGEEIRINRDEVQQYKWTELQDLFESINHNNPLFKNYKKVIKKVLWEFEML